MRLLPKREQQNTKPFDWFTHFVDLDIQLTMIEIPATDEIRLHLSFVFQAA
jgi:hypothetical protein